MKENKEAKRRSKFSKLIEGVKIINQKQAKTQKRANSSMMGNLNI